MPAHKFAVNERPTLGVEIELNLVDSQTMALRSAISEILAELPAELEGRGQARAVQCYLEINTEVCHDVAEVERDLAEKIQVVGRDRRAATTSGCSGAEPTRSRAGRTRRSRRTNATTT